MIDIKINMNSTVEDILSFKTCCGLKAFDQNFELLLTNTGERPVSVLSHLDLVLNTGRKRIDNLMPQGIQEIPPGQIIAFYCFMDEQVWEKVRELIVYDTQGNRYPESVTH